MPSSKGYKRDYRSEYEKYHASPEQRKKRAMRNKARRKMEKKHGKSALRGKDVDHRKPLAKGGGNSGSNLRLSSRSSNRSFRRTRNAKMK